MGCLAWMDETQVWLHAGQPPIDRGLVRSRLCNGRLAKAMMQTMGRMHKGRYVGYLHKGSSRNCGWGRVFSTIDLKKCKTADLVWKSKRRFSLVIRLIAIEYNMWLLCYLSSYINLLISDLWLNLDLWSRNDVLSLSHLLLTRCLVVIIIVIIICFQDHSNVDSWSY